MRQVEIRTVTHALTRSNEAIDGATLHGAALGITRNTAAAITLDRAALGSARDICEAAKLDLAAKRLARDAKLEIVRAFLRLARDLLRPHLGNQHNGAWTAAGFIRTLQIPVTPGTLIVVLETLAAYLADHPAAENAPLNITATQTALLADELLALENAANAQVVTVKNLLDARNAKFEALRKRISHLFKELEQVMASTDNRWLAFGFSIPGAVAIPDRPENVEVTVIGLDAFRVKWDKAARAKYYRVWLQVEGRDNEFLPIGRAKDLHFIIEAVPLDRTVRIALSAVGKGGESRRSEVFVLKTEPPGA